MGMGLAAMFLLGRRSHRHEQAHTLPRSDDCPPIEFHPELMVRWDDEADYARPVRCARRSSVDRRVPAHAQTTKSPLPQLF